MSAVRSRRWTVEVGPLEHLLWQEEPVECAWINYWQRAGYDTIEVQSVELWGQPWGKPIAALTPLDIRDNAPEWLKKLITEHMPGGGES